ncbi:MAG: dUTP diphosphatase [Gemmatimonadaceae bacterium]|nr:dUTP diphosphatase [Gemmatimonadaceae bacterium]
MTDDAAIRFEPLHEGVAPPSRSTTGSAGYDLRCFLVARTVRVALDGVVSERPTESTEEGWVLRLAPREKALVPLGFRAQLPIGVEAQVRPRSGLAFRTGLVIANSPGTIDADFPEEWCVPVANWGVEPLVVTHGERIAQMVLARFEVLPFVQEAVQPTTDRMGGFGSTGV